MNLEFSSKEELLKRVMPALKTKVRECKQLEYCDITEMDLWNYLIENKWKTSHNLTLSDIVNDILKADITSLDNYLQENKDSYNNNY